MTVPSTISVNPITYDVMLIARRSPGRVHVVERDVAQAVDAVDEREHQEHPVPRPPERARPAHRDEPEVDPLGAGAQQMHDHEVPEGEDQQHQAADPHEQPEPELAAADGPFAPEAPVTGVGSVLGSGRGVVVVAIALSLPEVPGLLRA